MEKERQQLSPEEDALQHIIAGKDKPFLEGRHIDAFKGRGLFTHRAVEPSEFVVEYRGKIYSTKTTAPEKKCADSLINYLFEFSWDGAHWCIDASSEDQTLGRLVNDDHVSPNCEMRKIVCEGKPHLCLFAIREISAGEEITFNYGDLLYPWRSTVEDSDASSSDESSYSDDNEDTLHESFANSSSQVDKDDSYFRDLNSSQVSESFTLQSEVTSFCQQDKASCSQEIDSDDTDSDEERRPRKASQKPENISYTKKSYCYICGAGGLKMSRHLAKHAKDDPELAKVFALRKNSKERLRLLAEFRNRGNYKHNQEVLKNKSGQLKLKVIPKNKSASTKMFLNCPYCKCMYRRKLMWKHVSICPERKTPYSVADGRTKVLSEIALTESLLTQKLPKIVWKMLLQMKQDEVAYAVQNDALLIELAKYFCEKYKAKDKHEYIREKLREMGRLLIGLREKSIFTFQDAIKPANFYKVVEVVKEVAGFSEKRQSYNRPTLALKLGHSLKKIGAIVLTQAEDKDEMLLKDTRKFMTLCTEEWSALVCQTAVASLKGQKLKNPSTLPFTRDMQLFYTYLELASSSAIESLKMQDTQQVYAELCRVALTQVSILNKCVLEVSKMTVKVFEEREDYADELSRHFIKINTQSRSGENIAVLLTSDLVSAITLLVSKRKACKVHEENPFLFAKPNSSPGSLYYGGNCIRAFSVLCRAKNAEHLRSVRFRKHVARVFKILNMENSELEHLGKVLGFEFRADREYYQLPAAVEELAKVAKLIVAMEKGELEKFKGKSLQAVEIDDELEPEVEEGSPETGDAEGDAKESEPQQDVAVKKQKTHLSPEQDALEHIQTCRDKPFLQKKFIDHVKGKGVFTLKPIKKSSFVVEFRGEIISHRKSKKPHIESLKNYLYDFFWNDAHWCIDASSDDGSLGRLVNDDHKSPNCKMRKIIHQGKPHLCLFAVKEISAGEEITYNYGDAYYAWRPKKSVQTRSDTNTAAPSPVAERARVDYSEKQQLEDTEELSSSAASGSEDEYVPESQPSSDLSEDEHIPEEEASRDESFSSDDSRPKSQKHPDKQKSNSDFSLDEFSSDEEPKVKTKGNYCYICGKIDIKISRHLFTHRHDVPEIAEVFSLPLYTEERKEKLNELRRRGNEKHNEEVLRTNRGELKVKRERPPDLPKAAKTFCRCQHCKVLYRRTEMRKHVQICSKRVKTKLTNLVSAVSFIDTPEISSEVSAILKSLKKDEITPVIMNDPYILLMARYFCHMDESKVKRKGNIVQKLRGMGKLLLTLRKQSISSFEEVMKPENFSKVVAAVRELAGYNEEEKGCEDPNVMMQLGSMLKYVAEINFALALGGEDKQKSEEADTLVGLCLKEFVSENMSKFINTTPAVAFMRDAQLLYQDLEQTAASGFESLTKYESNPVYTAFLRVTIARLSVVNKNVDISAITLKSFLDREETEPHGEAAAPPSQLKQILSKRLVKINVMDNKGEKVVMAVTPDLLSAINLFVSKREACEVPEGNPFLFATPGATSKTFFKGNICLKILVDRCEAKNKVNLRSAPFRKYLARAFQILSLTNEDLEALGKLLGREIQTDREYYQKPEAAGDIAKISELISAIESGKLERFEGKSFKEIEIADALEADNSDAEDNKVKSKRSFKQKAVKKKPKKPTVARDKTPKPKSQSKASSSKPKEPTTDSIFCLSNQKLYGTDRGRGRGRGRGRRRKQEAEDEASKLKEKKNAEEKTKQDDESGKSPESRDVNAPEKTQTSFNENMFSDDDDDMNVDFDMDIDTDEDDPRNQGNSEDINVSNSDAKPLKPRIKDVSEQDSESCSSEKNDRSGNKLNTDEDTEEEDHGEEDEHDGCMDVDRISSSPVLEKEKKIKIPASVTGLKEVKILIPRLDIEKLKAEIRLSRSSPAVKSAEKSLSDKDGNESPKSSTSVETRNKPSSTTEIQMICSHCKKIMVKGQTAYQKKGFPDVFCSKDCLFQMFLTNKPATKSCYNCFKVISQPLDLIMASVDAKGTMKDFCSTTCLCSFKSNPAPIQTLQHICYMCKKYTITRELVVSNIIFKFCSDLCLEDFRRDNLALCNNCGFTCCKPIMLNLKEETLAMCSYTCLDSFRKEDQTLHQCTMCKVSCPMSDMVTHNKEENIELFCSSACVTSYRLQPVTLWKHHGKKSSALLKNKKGGEQEDEVLNNEEQRDPSDSPSAESSDTPTIIITKQCYICGCCGKTLEKGDTAYQPKSSPGVFCSSSCFYERTANVPPVIKTCFNCSEDILRPHNIILAPVDDSGSMRELCSSKCLAAVNSKRTSRVSQCKMCTKVCSKNVHLTLDEFKYKVCSQVCFINYHEANNLPVVTCDYCGFASLKKFTLEVEGGSKSICSDECLVKFKEKSQKPQTCLMCQTSHRMSDMVENETDGGALVFFCSSRCSMVHKAQSLTVSEGSLTSVDEEDSSEKKPLPDFITIKQEPIEEEYKPDLPSSVSPENIKDETPVAQVDFKTEEASVPSSSGESESTAAANLTHNDGPSSCSSCRKVLIDGETLYQRKSHADIFCSSPCLLKFYQIKPVTKTCTFCLQVISGHQAVLQASVDDEGTMKDFCSQTCISSFNYKRMMTTKVQMVPVASHSQCSSCSRYCIVKHEVILECLIHKFCSDPCFLRFCNLNSLSLCMNCHSHCDAPLILRKAGGSTKLCSAECVSQYKEKVKTPQPCAMCSTSLLMSDMFEGKNSEGEVELFCSSSCMVASKIQAVSASGGTFDCDNCNKTAVPACHLAMPDASIRNFCSLSCAMAFKETQKTLNAAAAANPAENPEQSQCDVPPPSGTLLCSQCNCVIKSVPEVIQNKDSLNFVCSLACSQEFKMVNNIKGICEYCKNEKLIKDVKRVDGRDCCFCSDGCEMLYRDDLKKQWGDHCSLCTFCRSISKMVVKARSRRADEEFCSKTCKTNHNMLVSDTAKCGACGRKGKLMRSLPLVGDVKHFCELECLLLFCSNNVKMADSTAASDSTEESFPVITNVVSLAEALAQRLRENAMSTKLPSHTQTSASAPKSQTKAVEHASVQTVLKELKNKSTLVTPLVHNKGVSCTTQTVDTQTQTNKPGPKTRVVPVPVPVYVPLPLNMYSQFTPQPLTLPLPLPVPVFLPVPADGTDLSPKSKKRTNEPHSDIQGAHDEKSEREDRSQKEQTRNFTDMDADHQTPFNNPNDTSLSSLPQPSFCENPPPPLSCELQRDLLNPCVLPAVEKKEDPQGSQSSASAPPRLQNPEGGVRHKNKRKLEDYSQGRGEERQYSKSKTRKRRKLKSQRGVDAWRRWIQWRKSKTNLSSTRVVTPNEDLLRCSAAELSDGLCDFITEVKRRNGAPCSPDGLFYLCLCIQKHLFENGRVENIFTDVIYSKFCTEFTEILRGFRPSSGLVHSQVDEEFLWECKQLGAYSPVVLLNTLLFFCCKYLSFTTVEQHRSMSFAHIVRRTRTNQNKTKSRFLMCYPPTLFNEKERDAEGVPAKKQRRDDRFTVMMENTENPLRCPVRLYEFYLSKCSESTKQLSGIFYLQPESSCEPNSPLWFSSSPLDERTMEDMLVRILAVRQTWGEDGGGSEAVTEPKEEEGSD